jgi:hypothetical protein
VIGAADLTFDALTDRRIGAEKIDAHLFVTKG